MDDPFLLRREHAAELFLIRHGNAIPGPDEIIPTGLYDNLPLSAKGRRQAAALAERLGAMHFTAAYSSPLLRCQETAAPLLERLNLKLNTVESLREIRLGEVLPLPDLKNGDDLNELTQALEARQVEIARVAGAAGNWDVIKGSEPSSAFRERVVGAIDAIAAAHVGERVLIFAHGGVINAYAAEVLGLNREFFFPCANASISVVRASGATRVVFVLNDIAHLLRDQLGPVSASAPA